MVRVVIVMMCRSTVLSYQAPVLGAQVLELSTLVRIRVRMTGAPMDIRSACREHSKSMRWHRRAAPFLLRRLLHRTVPLELTFELLLWLLRLSSGSVIPRKAVAVARAAVSR